MEQNKPDDREWFEEKVFGERFLASIKPTGLGGCLTYMAQGCPPKHELVAKDSEGNYADESVSAMWFGFRLAQNRESQRIAELEAERDRLIDELRDAEARNAQKLSQIARLRDDAERYRYLKKVFEFACNAAPGLYDDDRHEPHRQSIAIDDAAIDEANEEDFGAALESGDE